MSRAGVRASTELVGVTQNIIDRLTPEDWAADSACHGWRVQDLVGHMAFFFNFIADPEITLPDNPSGLAERLSDAAAAERADWVPEQVIAYYREQSAAGLAALEALQAEELAGETLQMFELGSYRLAQLADAVAFDHLVHLHSDLLAPHGPVEAGVTLPVAEVIDPGLDWMTGGLPQMCGAAVRPNLEGPIGLRLTGATNRSYVIDADSEDDTSITITETDDLPADVAVSDALAFTRWSTRRSAWRRSVEIEGDNRRIAAVLDSINII